MDVGALTAPGEKGLAQAQEERAKTYAPTYERYLPFKRVVREALGPKSKQYKRIHLHLRAAATHAGEDEDGGTGGETEAPVAGTQPPAPAVPAAPAAPATPQPVAPADDSKPT